MRINKFLVFIDMRLCECKNLIKSDFQRFEGGVTCSGLICGKSPSK